MLRRSNLASIAAATGLSLALAACGGGGSSSAPTSVLPTSQANSPAKATDATATLKLRFPAHVGRVKLAKTTSGSARKPAFINPNGTSLVIRSHGSILTDPSSGQPYFTLGTQDPTTGISTLSIPLFSGQYNQQDLSITEYDALGGGDVLAYGYNTFYTDVNGNQQDGTFNLSPGGSASPVITMVMNATGIALTTDPVLGNDAFQLSASFPGNNACGVTGNGVVFYAFAMDASGTFILPGQTPGSGLTGADPQGPFPGVQAATLYGQSVGSGVISLTGTIFGPSVTKLNDPSGNAQLFATFSTPNPLSQITNPFFPPSTAYGYVELGGGWC